MARIGYTDLGDGTRAIKVDMGEATASILADAVAEALDDLSVDISEADITAIGHAVDVALRATALPITGSVAHDAADSGNPVKIGGYAKSSPPVAVGEGDRVNAWMTPTGEQHVISGGITAKVNSTITRQTPDATVYTGNGDVIADATTNPQTIACGRVNGGTGLILNATLIDGAAQALAGEFEVWIFDTTVTVDADNEVFTPTDVECATLVCIIPFSSSLSYVGDATAGVGGNRVYQADPVNRGFVCGAATTNLFWVLRARNAYTPVAAETFVLRLTVAQD
jgi:hypothetical protein